jgi:AcrR family transcriptional regulator
MRTHGWGGATPASDQEALDRILDAADEAIEARGANIRITDVARDLAVSRQTVYNYFPNTTALVQAAANRSGMQFMERCAEHLKGIIDPVDAMVEGVAFTLEWLPSDKNVQLFLAHDFPQVSAGITSDMAIQFGHGILQNLDVDWTELGLDHEALDFMVEYMLRILQSFMIDPGRPARAGKPLRDHLRRWIAPVLHSQLTTSAS